MFFEFVKVSEIATNKEVEETKIDNVLVETDLVFVEGEAEVAVVVEGDGEGEEESQFQKMNLMLI